MGLTGAANRDSETETQFDTTFSSCISIFPENSDQPLKFYFLTEKFDNEPK